MRPKPSGDLHAPASALLPVRAASVRERQRTVFAHSIIRGGAGSAAELTVALDRDPVAAAHYRGFRSSAARLDHLEHARLAYVSYRVGNAVFWTRKPVALPEGEAVLTDGKSMARARCGNRISFTPRRPAGPDVDLDIPEPPPARDEGNNAGGLPDAFDPRMIVHNPFPPYFGDGFAVGTGAGSAAGGPIGPGGSGVAADPDRGGYSRGFGGGSGGTGGLPLLSRNPVAPVLITVDPVGIPAVVLPAALLTYPGPVFAGTPGFTVPILPATLPGLSVVTLPVYGFPITIGFPIRIAIGGTVPTSGDTGNDGIGDSLTMPPDGDGDPPGSGPPPVLVSLLPPPDSGDVPDSDIPEPATALLFAGAVLALAIRRAVR